MTLEQVQKLSDNDLNVLIDNAINSDLPNGQKPDYCSDLNAVAELEKLVTEKGLRDKYGEFLNRIIFMENSTIFFSHSQAAFNESLVVAVTATARQRAEAFLLALS